MTALQLIDTNTEAFVPSAISDEEGGALFRAVLNLFGKWGVSDEQAAVLLDVPLCSYRRWKAAGGAGRLDRDTKARLSNLVGIHKALRYMFSELEQVYAWVGKPNTAFAGKSALQVMLGGELTDVMRVRRYLDAERGAW